MNKKYKVGDKVYVADSFWGMCEMTVEELLDSTINCFNPMIGTSGGFVYTTIYKANSKKGIRHAKILKDMEIIAAKMSVLQQQHNELVESLFPAKHNYDVDGD
jgi:hypothetical protein